MVRQILLCTGVALSMSALADSNVSTLQTPVVNKVENAFRLTDANRVVAKMNDGSNVPTKAVASKTVQWKRPAGQFWGTGYNITENEMGYYFTPVMLRPWVNYTFENLSTVTTGTPSWSVENWDNTVNNYVITTSSEENVTTSYLRYEQATAPTLNYNNMAYPLQYYGNTLTEKPIIVYANNNTESVKFGSGTGCSMAVSSHYWGLFTREAVERNGFIYYTGATGYPGMEDPEGDGRWFGTNNAGINAMATRFEKPDQPYLLNGVYYYYQFGQDIPNDIPMKAYVFKTANDAEQVETSSGQTIECLALGDLIAVSESFIPAAVYSDDNFDNAVEFKFTETNPVTGASQVVSLEIEDDITVIVTGFNADLGNGGSITTFLSTDTYDEGYGNLCFLGEFEETEDGQISYSMRAIKNFFTAPVANTTLGVLADVSYPWVVPAMVEQPASIKLANDGVTTEEVQGLQYQLDLMSTSETSDFVITYDGEDECEWLSVVDVLDEYQTNEETGDEEFTGYTALLFEATPNPNDENRVCHVKISIPAATYEITFLQGTNAEDPGAVDVVTANGKIQYYDLTGRRVVNPEKGVYVKVTGNKSEKVVL